MARDGEAASAAWVRAAERLGTETSRRLVCAWPRLPRWSPDLGRRTFVSYRLRPGMAGWSGVTLVPSIGGRSPGTLGVEVVSPDLRIVAKTAASLAEIEDEEPFQFTFAPLLSSDRGVFRLHVFARTDAQVRILEARWPGVGAGRLGRLFARPLGLLSFGAVRASATFRDEDELAKLMGSVGSISLEDHYWSSGWQTADLQSAVGLRGQERILEVGCGVGRLAHGLHGWYYGRYVGVDVIPESIAYCRRRFPRFEFHCLPVRSPYYNPTGTVEPGELVLPSSDRAFDVAVLFSVCTHLLPDGLRRMASELARVLVPGGCCLATFFLYTAPSPHALFRFERPWGPGCRVEHAETPEAAVAYDRALVEASFGDAGLVVEKVWPGSWSGNGGAFTIQDQVLFRREDRAGRSSPSSG